MLGPVNKTLFIVMIVAGLSHPTDAADLCAELFLKDDQVTQSVGRTGKKFGARLAMAPIRSLSLDSYVSISKMVHLVESHHNQFTSQYQEFMLNKFRESVAQLDSKPSLERVDWMFYYGANLISTLGTGEFAWSYNRQTHDEVESSDRISSNQHTDVNAAYAEYLNIFPLQLKYTFAAESIQDFVLREGKFEYSVGLTEKPQKHFDGAWSPAIGFSGHDHSHNLANLQRKAEELHELAGGDVDRFLQMNERENWMVNQLFETLSPKEREQVSSFLFEIDHELNFTTMPMHTIERLFPDSDLDQPLSEIESIQNSKRRPKPRGSRTLQVWTAATDPEGFYLHESFGPAFGLDEKSSTDMKKFEAFRAFIRTLKRKIRDVSH